MICTQRPWLKKCLLIGNPWIMRQGEPISSLQTGYQREKGVQKRASLAGKFVLSTL